MTTDSNKENIVDLINQNRSNDQEEQVDSQSSEIQENEDEVRDTISATAQQKARSQQVNQTKRKSYQVQQMLMKGKNPSSPLVQGRLFEEEEADQILDLKIEFEEEKKEETKDEVVVDEITCKKKVMNFLKIFTVVISHSSKFRIRWDLFVIVLVIYNCVQIPFQISFKPDDTLGDTISGYIIDCIFLTDIFINLRTSYVNEKNGLEIFDRKKIALKYIIHWRFITDVISIIPFELFYELATKSKNKQFKIFDLLKLIRLLRLGRIISYLKFNSQIKVGFRVGQLVFMFLMISHWFACLNFMLVDKYKTWIPPKDQENGVTSLFSVGIYQQYSTSLYYAILNVVCNEVSPTDPWQVIFSSGICLFGQLLNAFIFGNMAALMQNANRKDNQFQEQFDRIIALMKSISLPENVQDEVEQYLVHQQNVPHLQRDLEKLFSYISPPLKRQIQFHLYKNIIKNIPELKNLDNLEIRYIVSTLSTEIFMPNDIICRQYDKGKKFYFISQGIVEVFIKPDATIDSDQTGVASLVKFFVNSESKMFPPKLIRTLKEGEYFGEVALVSNLKRTATIKASDFCAICFLKKNAFLTTKRDFPQFYESVKKKIIENYNDENFRFRRKMIKNVPYFKFLPDHIIQELVYLLKPIRYEKGALVVKKDTGSDNIYFLKSGKIDVQLPLKNQEVMYVDTLQSGSCFSIYDAFHDDFKQKFDFRTKTICIVEVIHERDIKSLQMVYVELCDVIKMLKTQLEGIAKSGGLQQNYAETYSPSLTNKQQSASVGGTFGQRKSSFIMQNSFSENNDDKSSLNKKGGETTVAINAVNKISICRFVDFDYFKYATYQKDVTIEQEIAISYVRKRFKMALAKFFHKLKRQVIVCGITSKEDVSEKMGIQLLNFIRQKSLSVHSGETVPQPKSMDPFKLKLQSMLGEPREGSQYQKEGCSSIQLKEPDELQKQQSVVPTDAHDGVSNLDKQLILGPQVPEERKLDCLEGDASSLGLGDENNQSLHNRQRSTQPHSSTPAMTMFGQFLQKARTINQKQAEQANQEADEDEKDSNQVVKKSQIDLESLIQFSLSRQKIQKEQVSTNIQKALAKIDKQTDVNLINALKDVNNQIVTQQDDLLKFERSMNRRLKRMAKKLELAMNSSRMKKDKVNPQYKKFQFTPIVIEEFQEGEEDYTKQIGGEDDEAIVINTSQLVFHNKGNNIKPTKRRTDSSKLLEYGNDNYLLQRGQVHKTPSELILSDSSNNRFLGNQLQNIQPYLIKLDEEQKEGDRLKVGEYSPKGSSKQQFVSDLSKHLSQQHSRKSSKSSKTQLNEQRGPSMTAQIREQFEDMTEFNYNLELGPKFEQEKLIKREFYTQETQNDPGVSSQEMTELEWAGAVLQTQNNFPNYSSNPIANQKQSSPKMKDKIQMQQKVRKFKIEEFKHQRQEEIKQGEKNKGSSTARSDRRQHLDAARNNQFTLGRQTSSLQNRHIRHSRSSDEINSEQRSRNESNMNSRRDQFLQNPNQNYIQIPFIAPYQGQNQQRNVIIQNSQNNQYIINVNPISVQNFNQINTYIDYTGSLQQQQVISEQFSSKSNQQYFNQQNQQQQQNDQKSPYKKSKSQKIGTPTSKNGQQQQQQQQPSPQFQQFRTNCQTLQIDNNRLLAQILQSRNLEFQQMGGTGSGRGQPQPSPRQQENNNSNNNDNDNNVNSNRRSNNNQSNSANKQH